MRSLTTAQELEAIVGKPMPLVLMKQVARLDDGCRRILARSPLAGFGYRDARGAPHTTLIGGVRAESPSRVSFAWTEGPAPVRGGVSFVFLLPGVGETLRLNGAAVETGDRIVVDVEEAFIHCPRCILRSELWAAPRKREVGASVAAFLAAAPFALVSTWDAAGTSDTSPRGDRAGFLRLLDERTLLLPDRRGNQRADTFHNLLSNDRIALAAIIPGRPSILQLRGRGSITDDAAVLAPLAIGRHAPSLGIVIRIDEAAIVPSAALAAAKPWDAGIDRAEPPDLMAIATHHLTLNEDRSVKAALFRILARVLALFPAFFRRKIDASFAKELQDEGYERGLQPRTATIVEVVRETADAVTLLLEDPTDAPFRFRAGQYFTLGVTIGDADVRRAYSASSAPDERRLALTIKRVAGGACSTHVHAHVRAGDRVELLGPSGDFCLPAGAKELVMIAAGSGITPIMSILRAALAADPETRITLLYGNRTEADIIFAAALAALEGPRLVVRHFVGVRLDEATLSRELPRSEDAHFFVCGPEGMLAGAQRALAARRVPRARVHVERFAQPHRKGPAKPGRALPMLIEHHGARTKVEVAAGKTLLEAGLAAGIPMPFSCGIGNCGECRIRVVKGEVEMDEPNTLTPDERAAGYVLACCARPRTKLEVVVEEGDES